MDLLRWALVALPVVVGGLLGAPVVARALERGTFPIDWRRPPARPVRLLGRTAPRAALAVVGLAVCGWAAAELQWATTPWLPRGVAGMEALGTHGALLVARGLLCLALGLLVGALRGRVLVAAVLAGLLGLGMVTGGADLLRSTWADGRTAVPLASLPGTPGSVLMVHGVAYRNQYGRLWSRAQGLEITRFVAEAQRDPEAWLAEEYEVVPLAIPMSDLPDLERSELAGTLGAALLLAGPRAARRFARPRIVPPTDVRRAPPRAR